MKKSIYHMRKGWDSPFKLVIAFIFIIGIVLNFSNECFALESTGNAKMDAFISDSRFTNGISWISTQGPKISTWPSEGCCAYCADYVKYCYGKNSPKSGGKFTNINEIRSGDVIILGPENGGGHWFVVLKRSGNNLYVAEGNYSSKVRIGWNYTINGNKFSQDARVFSSGYHYLDASNTEISIGSGYYKLQCAERGGARFLDVVGNQTANGTNIGIYGSVTYLGQTFYVDRNANNTGYYFLHKGSGKFVSTETNSAGTNNVCLWEGNGNDGQQWIFEDAGNGFVYVKNLYGYYLEVCDGVFEDGRNVQVNSFNGSDAQKWNLVKISGNETKFIDEGYYKLQCGNPGNSKFLDVVGNLSDNGTNIWLCGSVVHGGQTFYIGYNSETRGYYIRHEDSKKYVSTESCTTGQHNVCLWEGNGNDGQQWLFEDAGDGYVYVRNLFGYYLDVYNNVFEDGTNVQTHSFNGSSAQKWKLVKVSGVKTKSIENGYYKLQSSNQKYMDVAGNGSENGTSVRLWDSQNSGSQKFYIGYNSETRGYYIRHEDSKKYISTESFTTGEHNACLWEGNGNMGQQWLFEDAGYGYVYARNLFGFYLSLKDSDGSNGTLIRTQAFNKSDAEKWKLVKLSECEVKGHKWDNGTVTKDATEKEKGIKTYKCLVCGETRTEEIPVKTKSDRPSSEQKPNVQPVPKNNGIGTISSDGKTLTDTDKVKYFVSGKLKNKDLKKNLKIADKKSGGKYKITKVIKKNGKVVGGNVTYMAPYNKNCTNATAGATVKLGGVSFKITALNMNAFKDCKKLTTFKAGGNMLTIGKNAFNGCSSLKSVTITSTKLKSIGSNAFEGTTAKTKFKVPKSKLAKYSKMIYKAGANKKAKIIK